jgi:arsenate reductase
MAQGFLQSFGSDLTVCSAGIAPSEKVNDNAVRVMKEIGIDISGEYPKHVNSFLKEEWDYVITVCGGAQEACPVFEGKVKHRLHFGFDDPAAVKGSTEHVESEFRRIRDEIKNTFFQFYTSIKE